MANHEGTRNNVELRLERARTTTPRKDLQTIEAELRRHGLSPETGERRFQIGVLLVAAWHTGPFAEKLTSFTGYPASLVAEVETNMRNSGFWTNEGVNVDDWFDDDGNWRLERFLLHILVADGRCVARQDESGEWKYRPRVVM